MAHSKAASLGDYMCDACKEDDKNLKAIGYCIDCLEYLCSDCFEHHLKPRVTKHHKLQKLVISQDSSVQEKRAAQCPRHRGKDIMYYCLDHDVVGCAVCKTLDHESCPGIRYISNIATGPSTDKEYRGLLGKFQVLLMRMRTVNKYLTRNKDRSEGTFVKVLTDVTKERKDVMESFDKLETDIKEEAEKIRSKDTQEMDRYIELVQALKVKTEGLVSQMKHLKDEGLFSDLFIAMKTDRTQVNILEEMLDMIGNDNTITDYSFKRSERLEEFQDNEQDLGTIQKKQKFKASVAEARKIDVRTGNDEQCSIMGLASLSNNRLVATDYKNMKVKLVDTDQDTVVSELTVKGKPYDASETDEPDTVMVTLPHQCLILVLKIQEDRLLQYTDISTSGKCFSVSPLMDSFVVSLTNPERIEIIDQQGTILYKIIGERDGKYIFRDITRVVVNQDRGTLLLTDSARNAVICLSMFGHVKAVQDSHVNKPACVTVARDGVFYVVDSKNVHQMLLASGERSSSDKHVKLAFQDPSVLLSRKDGLALPQAACYCAETVCLFVGQDCDTILAFSLANHGDLTL